MLTAVQLMNDAGTTCMSSIELLEQIGLLRRKAWCRDDITLPWNNLYRILGGVEAVVYTTLKLKGSVCSLGELPIYRFFYSLVVSLWISTPELQHQQLAP
jgi:hypothetical protein